MSSRKYFDNNQVQISSGGSLVWKGIDNAVIGSRPALLKEQKAILWKCFMFDMNGAKMQHRFLVKKFTRQNCTTWISINEI